MARWRMTAERGSLWMSELAGLATSERYSATMRAYWDGDISWATLLWIDRALHATSWPQGSLEAAAQAIVDGRR